MRLRYLSTMGLLYLVITALLFGTIGLLGFASTLRDAPPASLMRRR
jgi:hypothetical protein